MQEIKTSNLLRNYLTDQSIKTSDAELESLTALLSAWGYFLTKHGEKNEPKLKD